MKTLTINETLVKTKSKPELAPFVSKANRLYETDYGSIVIEGLCNSRRLEIIYSPNAGEYCITGQGNAVGRLSLEDVCPFIHS